jgi:3',5'-cyclic AMP phosphodiesterase CpdA
MLNGRSDSPEIRARQAKARSCLTLVLLAACRISPLSTTAPPLVEAAGGGTGGITVGSSGAAGGQARGGATVDSDRAGGSGGKATGGTTVDSGGAGGSGGKATGGATVDSGGAGGSGGKATGGAGGTGASGGTTGNASLALLGAPLAFNPTSHGFGLNAVAAQGDPSLLNARIRAAGTATWDTPVSATVRAPDLGEWSFDGLGPNLRYEYEVRATEPSGTTLLYSGSAVTQRAPGASFSFALITDSHIGADLTYSNQGDPEVLAAVSAQVDAVSPDFLIHLGDMLDFHQFGFNLPPPTSSIARAAYLNYRSLLGNAIGHAAHFPTIGNWEGEDGTYTAEEIDRSRSQRLLYLPGPSPATYPESGSVSRDYYAFTWGDALFIVLNVMTYTTTPHLLSSNPGLPDDWTLGAAQLGWLETTLAHATAKWRFLLIHHTVGGAAGTPDDSAYGRGGGQAAYVGEQATVHQLMLQYGAQIFFYGHDHVFTDLQVDGIHYTLPGNAGAVWMFSPSETGYPQSWLEYGWGLVTVSPQQVHVQFLKLSGDLLYEYTVP